MANMKWTSISSLIGHRCCAVGLVAILSGTLFCPDDRELFRTRCCVTSAPSSDAVLIHYTHTQTTNNKIKKRHLGRQLWVIQLKP